MGKIMYVVITKVLATEADKKQIQPGNVEVQSVADKVSNGEVWILRGVINPAS